MRFVLLTSLFWPPLDSNHLCPESFDNFCARCTDVPIPQNCHCFLRTRLHVVLVPLPGQLGSLPLFNMFGVIEHAQGHEFGEDVREGPSNIMQRDALIAGEVLRLEVRLDPG